MPSRREAIAASKRLGRVYSIGDLTQEFDITPRTVRYYEQVGLLQPERHGQRRIFHERDRVRLRLVLRGRRLGFNLGEIAEMINLYDVGGGEVQQLQRTLSYGREKIKELEARRAEITAAIDELRDWDRRLHARLEALRAREGAGEGSGEERGRS